MKKLSKTIFSIAAVAAVSAVMAASAMAMSASYADGVVTLSDVTATGDSQTLLVLSEDAATVTEGIIKQIDQKDDGSSFGTVKVGTLTDGTYYVRVGGSNGSLQTATFTVGSQGGGDVETKDILIGDTALDGSVTSTDVGHVSRYALGYTNRIGQVGTELTKADGTGTFLIGDSALDGSVTSTDVGHVSRYALGYTNRIGQVGTTVTVVAE